MTNEELMQPRYKVIADYPYSKFKVGQVLKSLAGTEFFGSLKNHLAQKDLDTMPHLFKKLNWWEERKALVLPDYLKVNTTGEIQKVTAYYLDETKPTYYIGKNPELREKFFLLQNSVPATEEEVKQFNEKLTMSN